MTKEQEIAWAAGLFEGEGYCGLIRSYPVIALGMTNRDVVEKFARIVDAGTVYYHRDKRENHSDTWDWRLTNKQDVIRVLNLLLPYLSDLRQEQAHKVLERTKSIREYNDSKTNHALLKSLGLVK